MFTQWDKMLASFFGPAIVSWLGGALAGFGITGQMDVQTLVTMLVTAFFTYLVPGFGKTLSGFLSPAIVAAVMGVAQGVGVTGSMNWKTAMMMALTGILTHIAQNKGMAQHPTFSIPR